MNLITFWGYGINNKGFEELVRLLKVESCTQLYVDDEDKNTNLPIKWEAIFLYKDPKYILNYSSVQNPISEDLLKKMQPYELTAMDIIFRWRRSITTKSDYKSIKNIYYKYLEFWNEYIDNRRFDCFIITGIPHIPILYLIYALCKIKDIPIILLDSLPLISTSNIKGLYIGIDIGKMDSKFQMRYQANLLKYENVNIDDIDIKANNRLYFSEYGKNPEDVKRVTLLQEKNNLLERLKIRVERAQFYIREKRYAILVNKFIYLQKIKASDKGILQYAKGKETEPDFDDKFILFLLHYQPESTTLPKGGVFENQLLAIKIIASALDEDLILYVKEHPAFWEIDDKYESILEVRSKDFYDEILSLNNVKLIRHDYNSLKLIDNSFCLATITGTAGWEALFRGKNVIMFGNYFYSDAPNVHNVRNKEDCESAIDQIKNQKESNMDIKNMMSFLKALEDVSADTFTPDLTDANSFSEHDFIHFKEEENGIIVARAIENFIMSEYPDLLN